MDINTCRACLLQKDPKDLWDWFMPMDNIDEPLTVLECFQICTQLELKKTSPIAPHIVNMHYLCKACVDELLTTFKFIRKAQRSDYELGIQVQKYVTTYQTVEFEWINTQAENRSSVKNGDFTENFLYEDVNKGIELFTGIDYSEENKFNNYSIAKGELHSLKANKQEINRDHNDKNGSENNIPHNIEIGKCNASGREVKLNISICEYCSKAFESNELKRHIKRSHSMNFFLCHSCPSTFNDAAGLKKHEDIHKANRERTISCKECQRRFFTQQAYQNHTKIHQENREAKFQCDQCEKSFFYKGSLKLHMQLHSGLLYECNICSKQYARSVDLRIHLRSHSGELPYKCPQCDKRFRYVHVLNKHVRYHEGHRYTCNVCGKEYAHQSTMLQHRKEHTGLPLRCSICDKGFVKKSKMRRHIGGVHKVSNIEEIDQLIVKVKTKNIYRGRVLEM